MNKSLRILVGFLISGFCLWLVFRHFDFAALSDSHRQASYVWVLPTVLIFSLNMTLRSFRWRVFISSIKPLSLSLVAPTLITGFFMNQILPARAGEFIRAITLAKKTDMPVASVLGTVVAERGSDFLGLFLAIGIASRLLSWDKLPVMPVAGAFLLIVAGMISFIWFSRKVAEKKFSVHPLVAKVLVLFSNITAGFKALQSARKVATVVILSLIIWLNEILMPFFLAKTFHLPLTFTECAALLTGLSVGVMIPAGPGFIGTYEFFGKTVLEMLGKPGDAALGFVVLLHTFHLLMTTIAGVPSLLYLQFRGGQPGRNEPN